MATVISIQAIIRIEKANEAPVIDEQPPALTVFKLGTAASVPFGKVHDTDGDPLTLTLVPPVPGCTVTLAGDQITLAYDGSGAIGDFQAAVEISDGKP